MCWFIHRFFKSKGISYHQGQKQRYLISCSFPVFSFVLDITCMAKWKKQSAGTWSLSGLYSLVAYLALLSYPLTLFNTNWKYWTKKQVITSTSCLPAMCLNPKTAHGPIFTQDQASMALEEITSPIQNQVFSTLESKSTPDKRSKFRPSGETKGSLLPSSRVAQRKINDGSSAVQE